MSLALRYAVRSDKGLVRGNNEDSVYAGPRLLAIADGMGGHAGGEVASKIVIGAMEELDEDRHIDDLITSLREAVEDANESLSLAVQRDPKLDGMGTTLTALRFSGSRIGLVHVGDSRAYLLRGGQLAQITHDDTYVQSLVDTGRLTLEEAAHHPRKSVILRALNGVEVDPDVSIREAREGDRYLLCTDGLTDVLRAETLREALSEGDPQECADNLVALALRGGGPDNVTCIVADVVQADRGNDVPVVAGAVVDPGQDTADDESPAARAAGLGSKGVVARLPEKAERRWPRIVVPAAIVVALVAAAVTTWQWTQKQYFVGRAHGVVVIYRGVDTAFGPLKFYKNVENTSVKVSDLIPSARTLVAEGITAHSRKGAEGIVARLKSGQLLPVCPSTATTSTPPPSTPPATSAPSSTGSTFPSIPPVTSAGATSAGVAAHHESVSPTPSTAPTSAAATSAAATSAAATSAAATSAAPTSAATASVASSPVRGVDCR